MEHPDPAVPDGGNLGRNIWNTAYLFRCIVLFIPSGLV